MVDRELKHHGVRGMRWGVRRYQNADGTLTAAGQRRLDRDRLDNNDRNRQVNPNKWVREDISRSKKLTDSTKDMTRELKKANDDSVKRKAAKAKMDLSHMSDKEMRDAINRAMLEKQYNDIYNPQKVSKGRERVGEILEVSGTVLGIAGSALGIALAIKDLRA